MEVTDFTVDEQELMRLATKDNYNFTVDELSVITKKRSEVIILLLNSLIKKEIVSFSRWISPARENYHFRYAIINDIITETNEYRFPDVCP